MRVAARGHRASRALPRELQPEPGIYATWSCKVTEHRISQHGAIHCSRERVGLLAASGHSVSANRSIHKLFCVFSCLKAVYLVSAVDSLALNSRSSARRFMPKCSSSATRPLPRGHFTALLHTGQPDSTPIQAWGPLQTAKPPTKSKREKRSTKYTAKKTREG